MLYSYFGNQQFGQAAPQQQMVRPVDNRQTVMQNARPQIQGPTIEQMYNPNAPVPGQGFQHQVPQMQGVQRGPYQLPDGRNVPVAPQRSFFAK